MNTSSDPSPDPSPDLPSGAPAGSGFFTWLRNLGITRSTDRWFAGVAGGIAAKAGIDPLIVRGVFVVLTLLGGPGLLLYLVGWLFLPDSTGRIHTEEIIRGRASSGMIVAASIVAGVIIIPLLIGLLFGGAPLVGTPGFWGWDLWSALGVPLWLMRTISWLFWIAVLVAAFFLVRHFVLQRGRERGEAGGRPARVAPDPSPAPGAAPFAEQPASTRPFTESAEEWAARTSEQAERWGRDFGERANRWGEEVGKQADEWSTRYAEHHDAHRMGAGQVVLTLASALLAGGAAAVWAGFDGTSAFIGRVGTGAAPALVAGITAALAVLAVSLIIAGIRGRHTGWVGFLSACGVVALLATVVLPAGTRFQPFGTMSIDGRSATGAVLIAGNTDIDLRDLDERTDDTDLVIWQLAGNANVVLSESAPVDLDIRVLAGRIDDRDAPGGGSAAGPFLNRAISIDADRETRGARPSAAPTSVTVYLLAGNARVTAERTSSSTNERERETAR